MSFLGFGRRRADADYVAYYEARAAAVRKTAYVLCGDWHLAEDLTQIAFTKLYRAWPRLERHEALDGYVRQTLLRAFLDDRRRPWHREHATGPGSGVFDVPVAAAAYSADREILLAALNRIPKRRRAVLVLRYWEDLSVEQVADLLDCSAGTVRSQASRGLADLRAALGDDLVELMLR
ncbi:SigE family RNA polymerase sigma factor [Hamadaea tsunoensis]|uniref:SigE family RNA polymerase sigma factor n=1 Tax=Hamadaea tsunoensis TaxID=53368 RepID=UPI00041F0F91|nr:SigE family RNA polymerase sigma factor [Hamadaea tsunoensis]